MSTLLAGLRQTKQLLGPDDILAVIFDGDIFDKGMENLQSFLEWLKFFIEIYQLTDGHMYSVVGNHEITYKHSNLFWMMADVQSEWLKHTQVLTADMVNFCNILKIVDEVQLGHVLYVMGHYHRDLSDVTDEYINEKYPGVTDVVLVTHNCVLTDSIIKAHAEKSKYLLQGTKRFISLDTAGILPRTTMLKRVFVGHMHQAYAKFDVTSEWNGIKYDFVIDYLASIGRTNVLEVRDDFCERHIPVVFESDGLIEYGEDPFSLIAPVKAIDEIKRVQAREAYEATAEIRALKSVDLLLDDPVESLSQAIQQDSQLRLLFSCALTGSIPTSMVTYLESARAAISKFSKR